MQNINPSLIFQHIIQYVSEPPAQTQCFSAQHSVCLNPTVLPKIPSSSSNELEQVKANQPQTNALSGAASINSGSIVSQLYNNGKTFSSVQGIDDICLSSIIEIRKNLKEGLANDQLEIFYSDQSIQDYAMAWVQSKSELFSFYWEKEKKIVSKKHYINIVLNVILNDSKAQLAKTQDEFFFRANIINYCLLLIDQMEFICELYKLGEYIKHKYPPSEYSYVFPGRSLILLSCLLRKENDCNVVNVPFSKGDQFSQLKLKDENHYKQIVDCVSEEISPKIKRAKILAIDYVCSGAGFIGFKTVINDIFGQNKLIEYRALPTNYHRINEEHIILKNKYSALNKMRESRPSLHSYTLMDAVHDDICTYGQRTIRTSESNEYLDENLDSLAQSLELTVFPFRELHSFLDDISTQ